MMLPPAPTDVPIHDLLARRFSPYCFADEPVSAADLRALFEAARWAPSSYNEQPWRFIVARREDPAGFAAALECLVEGNRTWARFAPVLVITATVLHFARGGKPNRHAFHDVGLAMALLTVEATARGLAVHQMAGILPDVARQKLALPDGVEAVTGVAIGKAGPNPSVPPDVAARDQSRRGRRPIEEILFSGAFGRPAVP